MYPRSVLPRGILSVLQTPFTNGGRVDVQSLMNLMAAALKAGVNGFLAPVVASEVDFLTVEERELIIRTVAAAAGSRVPFIVGASSGDPAQCLHFARAAEHAGATAYLVAVPPALYRQPEQIPQFFQSIAEESPLPLVIQDLQWNGPGLTVAIFETLRSQVRTLSGVKIETIPAGPKYTAVRGALGEGFWIAGGWAIPQMIEALDRGVDALIPESAMIPVYAAIWHAHANGQRQRALQLFRRLVPVLTFANQQIELAIAFFKRLLVRKGIFRTPMMRQTWPGWDQFNSRIADELIELYLELEREVEQCDCHQSIKPALPR